MALEDLNYEGFMFARVVNNIDPKNEGRVQVLPKRLLMNNVFDKGINEEDRDGLEDYLALEEQDLSQLRENLLIGKDVKKSKDEATVSQYIWVRPLYFLEQANKYQNGGSWRIPKLNQHILIMFIDADPQKGYYLPFTPTINGDTYSLANTSLDLSETGGDKKKISEKVVQNHVISMNDNGTRIEVDNNYETNSVNTILDKFTLDKPPQKRDYVFRRMQNYIDEKTDLNEKIWEGIYYETGDLYLRPNAVITANPDSVYNHFTIDSTRKDGKYKDEIRLETGHKSYLEIKDTVDRKESNIMYNLMTGQNYGGCYFKLNNNYETPGSVDRDEIKISTKDENYIHMTNTKKPGTYLNNILIQSTKDLGSPTYIKITKDGGASGRQDNIMAITHTKNYAFINSDSPGADYIEFKTPKGTKVIIDNRPGEEILSIDSKGNKIDLINGDIFIVCENLNATVKQNTYVNTAQNTTIVTGGNMSLQAGGHMSLSASTISISAGGLCAITGNPITLN